MTRFRHPPEQAPGWGGVWQVADRWVAQHARGDYITTWEYSRAPFSLRGVVVEPAAWIMLLPPEAAGVPVSADNVPWWLEDATIYVLPSSWCIAAVK